MVQLNDASKFKLVEESLYNNLPDIKGAAYDNKARLYEKLVGSKFYNKAMWGTLPGDYKEFAENAILHSKGSVLDIGCGGLVQTAALYSVATSNYILLDNSIEMLRIAKQRISRMCNKIPGNIKFLQADAFKLPFENNRFDSVFSFGLIHLFEHKKAFINEAIRVLKPGRKFYFTSLTSDRLVSKVYMNLLKKQHEIAEPLSSTQTTALFDPDETAIDCYMKGSMIFINGTKLKFRKGDNS